MSDQIKEIEKEFLEKKSNYPDFKAGDTVIIHVKIKEIHDFIYALVALISKKYLKIKILQILMIYL